MLSVEMKPCSSPLCTLSQGKESSSPASAMLHNPNLPPTAPPAPSALSIRPGAAPAPPHSWVGRSIRPGCCWRPASCAPTSTGAHLNQLSPSASSGTGAAGGQQPSRAAGYAGCTSCRAAWWPWHGGARGLGTGAAAPCARHSSALGPRCCCACCGSGNGCTCAQALYASGTP